MLKRGPLCKHKDRLWKSIAVYMVLFFVLPSSGIGAIKLCLGRDGHMAISLTGNKECCDTDRATAQKQYAAVPVEASRSSGCLPCVDIPISVDSEHRHLRTTPHTEKFSRHMASPAIRTLDSARLHECLSAYSILVPSLSPPVCETRRTVVLIM